VSIEGTAIVNGGQGAAHARLLAEQGARVAFTDLVSRIEQETSIVGETVENAMFNPHAHSSGR
jgi:NAD(P)-dependent dehydrogenase (short-subunit alcohol dehydrogenase family)